MMAKIGVYQDREEEHRRGHYSGREGFKVDVTF